MPPGRARCPLRPGSASTLLRQRIGLQPRAQGDQVVAQLAQQPLSALGQRLPPPVNGGFEQAPGLGPVSSAATRSFISRSARSGICAMHNSPPLFGTALGPSSHFRQSSGPRERGQAPFRARNQIRPAPLRAKRSARRCPLYLPDGVAGQLVPAARLPEPSANSGGRPACGLRGKGARCRASAPRPGLHARSVPSIVLPDRDQRQTYRTSCSQHVAREYRRVPGYRCSQYTAWLCAAHRPGGGYPIGHLSYFVPGQVVHRPPEYGLEPRPPSGHKRPYQSKNPHPGFPPKVRTITRSSGHPHLAV